MTADFKGSRATLSVHRRSGGASNGRRDEIAAGAGGRGHLRASRADREQVIGALKAAFVAGMLAKEEFDLRVGQALAARTGAELAVLTVGLPAGLTAARPSRPARAQRVRRGRGPGQWVVAGLILAAGSWAIGWLLSAYGDNHAAGELAALGLSFFVVFLIGGVAESCPATLGMRM